MPSAAILERRTRAVQLHRSGMSLDEIADELGYANRSGPWKAIQRALDAQQAATVEEYRRLEEARLDALQAAVWDRAMSGDPKAIEVCLRISDRRVRLLGLVPDGNQMGRRRGGGSVVVDEFWAHIGDAHGGDWRRCRCNQVEDSK